MPRYNVSNVTDRRFRVRTADRGLVTLLPTQSEVLELAESHARYYGASGLQVDSEDGQQVERTDPAKPTLADLGETELREIADKEKIELGDTDLSTDEGRAHGRRIIAEFRRIYESGTADMVRAEAAKLDGMDADALDKADTKYAVVNLMIATAGVPEQA